MTDHIFLKHIDKGYKNKTILRDVSCEFNRGEITGILGPNGAGKTTLFYTATGLIKPTSGYIYWNEKNITHDPFYVRARMGIAYLPQDQSIFQGLTVEKNILAALESRKMSKVARMEKLDQLLHQLNIEKLRKEKSTKLSGGERKRLEIARTLALNPKFIFLDEPLAGVDPLIMRELRHIISDLKSQGLGIIITDHNVKELFSFIDQAYILFDGKILAHDKPEVLAKNKIVRQIYLGQEFSW